MKISIFRGVLIVIAIIVGFLAIKYSLANLNYLKVDAYLYRWEKSEQLTQEELSNAFIASDAMLALHGHHPHYLNMTAKLYEWQAFLNKDDRDSVDRSYQKALILYKQSSELRGHWPLTWGYMANIQSQLGLLDQDFYRYLDNAIVYGPYMKEVNLLVAKLFLKHWGNLPGFSAKTGLEQVKRTLHTYQGRDALLTYAHSIGKDKIVCTVGRLNKIESVIHHKFCQ
ncbi:VpsP family polysaccharide biosynthesis protein [Psychromonas sp.]|nr:VpsP family polysaccharide biosynthesis protein [Psychromonas sp.]